LLRISVILGLLAGFALSPKLWLSSRVYPFTPVWSFFKPPNTPIDYIAFFALLALLAFQDQARWQPWFYQYVVMLLAIALAGSKRPEPALNTCALIIGATYIWSGLSKLNSNFMGDAFPWLVTPFIGAWPFVRHLSYSAALMECGAGVGLLFRRFRSAAFSAPSQCMVSS
jgi:hypothetical protein